jgi:hypothetical protein
MLKYFKFFCKTLYVCVPYIPLYAKAPHPLALKRFGIRIVAVTHNSRQEEDLCNGAYEALILLEQFDNEMFDRVKRFTRMICLSPTNGNAGCAPTFGLYFISALRFPASYPTGKLPITIAGFLVWHATLVKLKACMAQYEKVNGAAKLEVCQKRHLLTVHKLEQGLCES